MNIPAVSCAVWGHHVDNHVLGAEPADHRCRCGTRYLTRDGSLTRVRHTLSCFLGTHTYVPLAERNGCREYVCVQCGHPLVYPDGSDPYRQSDGFRKRVRYLCGLFGHRVRRVAVRDGYVEHACHGGHSFLKPLDLSHGEARSGLEKIRHPMICVLLGHWVQFVTARGGYDEFICVNCGHPFCFAKGTEKVGMVRAADRPHSPVCMKT